MDRLGHPSTLRLRNSWLVFHNHLIIMLYHLYKVNNVLKLLPLSAQSLIELRVIATGIEPVLPNSFIMVVYI